MTIRQNSFIAGEMISRKQMDQMGMPIGNPHKPPFKQKEMPFFIAPAVTAASVAIGTAATVGSMAAIGTAALATVGAIGTIAAVAGTAMSVVGMVTGDKSLMKLGAIVGLAGGVASLASGAVASLAAGGKFALGTAGIESANAANATAAQAASMTAGAVGANSANAVGGLLNQPVQQGMQNAASGLTSGAIPQASTLSSQAGGMSPLLGKEAVGGFSPVINNVTGNVGAGVIANTSTAGGALTDLATAGNLSTTGSSGFFNKLISDMTPKDYLLMGGSVISGGMNAVEKNQANAEKQQAYEYKQAQRNAQLKNMNTPLTLSPNNTLQVGNYSKNPDLVVKV